MFSQHVSMLEESNVRERVLSCQEFQKLYECCLDYPKPIVMTAYYLPMRKSEILRLTWKELDLKDGFI